MKRYVLVAGVNGAGKIAIKKIDDFFNEEKNFYQETTLCGNSILEKI